MKPEEALKELEEYRQFCADDHGHEVSAFRAEALRIVLAMAKAAQGMARVLEEARRAVMETFAENNAQDNAMWRIHGDAGAALDAFRKATGGDAPEGPKP